MEMVDIRSESPLFRIASTSFTRIAILLGPDEWEKLRSLSVTGDITIISEVWPRGDRIATTFYILSTVDFHNANAFFTSTSLDLPDNFNGGVEVKEKCGDGLGFI